MRRLVLAATALIALFASLACDASDNDGVSRPDGSSTAAAGGEQTPREAGVPRPEDAPAAAAGWQKVYDRGAAWATSIDLFDDEVGLAVMGGGVHRTTDGGLSWDELTSSPDGVSEVTLASRTAAWSLGPAGAIFRTDATPASRFRHGVI